jgi:hypothetical protein
MPDTDKPSMPGKFRQLRLDSIGLKIDPSDNALDRRMMIREIEKPAGLLDTLPRLDGY